MKNKKYWISLLIILIILSFLFYPRTFRCGISGKKIEQTFFNVNIYGERDIKDAECKRRSLFDNVYECVFTFQNEKLDIIIDRDLFVVFKIPEKLETEYHQNSSELFNLCEGRMLTDRNKNYCILYKCEKI